MSRAIEVRWQGELEGTPEQVWEAITVRADGWLWKIVYEPRVGGSETGLTAAGGTVTVWEPHSHFTTRGPDLDGFNQLDFVLEPRGAKTFLSYIHNGVLPDDDYDIQADACRQHTAFYNHSLGQYVRHFAGLRCDYVTAEAEVGFAAVRAALGLPAEVEAGDRVRLTPAGLTPIDGVVDYATPAFLGVRSDDALYRFYGRDVWGWPVGVAHHLFAGGDSSADWNAWLVKEVA
ncbi:SRPBCC domain-containing protein [Nonomuraea sp. NPDC059007]|uniref:SRPBCC family protein n=1 Tax=Nonomuraea sp. NPDC059007 TaxID=3346692 RepID=UPI0036A03B95